MSAELDRRIVQQAQRGDERATTQVVDACRPLLRRALAKRLNEPEAREDVVQESLSILVRKLPEFRWEARFETWVLAIAFRVQQRYVQTEAQRRERTLLASEMAAGEDAGPEWEGADDGADPARHAERGALREALADCLSRISLEMREVWVRHRLWGHQHNEIAAAMSIKIDTVGTRIYRVDGKMRDCLQSKGYAGA